MNFHDAKIQGLFFDEVDEKLSMQLVLPTNKKVTLEFIEVVGWEFSPFEEQNVLFEVQSFDSEGIPDWFITEFNIPRQYLDVVLSREKRVFYLQPSVGLGGWIVAGKEELKNL